MTILIASLVFFAVFIFVPTRDYFKLTKVLKEEKAQGHIYKVFSDAKLMLIIQGAMFVFSIFIGIIYGPDQSQGQYTWYGIAIAMSGSAIGSMIGAVLNRRLMYTDKGFLLKTHFVAYKSIKHFTRRKSILGVTEVETFKGEQLTLTNKCAAFLQELAKKK
jgi:hypothetical protein